MRYLILISLFVLQSCFGGVSVTIENNSSGSIKDVLLIYTGGTQSIREISANTSRSVTVNASSESDMKISFVDSDGKKHSQKIGVYFERGYSGNVIIKIGTDGNVTWVDKIELY